MGEVTFKPKFVRLDPENLIPVEEYLSKMPPAHARKRGDGGKKSYTKPVGSTPLGQGGKKDAPAAPAAPAQYTNPRDELYAVRIGISDLAETTVVQAVEKPMVLKTEMGMNIVIPKGKIKALRFKIHLFDPDHADRAILAIDGFPSDQIKKIEGPKLSVKLALNKAFQFIPLPGSGTLGEIADISFGPWEFQLGTLKKVQVDFSEPGTDPEWFFQGDGIENQLRVTVTLRKPDWSEKIDARVWAFWDLKTSLFRSPVTMTDDPKVIHVWPGEA